MANKNYLQFITGVHFAKSMMNTINSITFLFDPNWESGVSEYPTFPIAFYHVKSIHEIKEAQISKKPMLFYNAQKSVSNNSVTGGLLNVVADNIILQPKKYKMELLVPYQNLTLLENNFTLQTPQVTAVMNLVVGGNTTEDTITPFYTFATPYVKFITDLLRSMLASDFTDVNSFISSVMSTPDYNKNSLEAMMDNRAIVKMKLWNGWRYKYVAITSLDFSKDPAEDGVYQATMEVQEVPIMTIRNDSGLLTKLNYTNPIVTAAGNLIKKVINGKEEK